MFCQNCGAENPNDTKFCSCCGSALTPVRPAQQNVQPSTFAQQTPVQPSQYKGPDSYQAPAGMPVGYSQPAAYAQQNYNYTDREELRRGSSCARKALTMGILSLIFSWTVIFGILFAAIGLKKASSAKKQGCGGGKATVGKVLSIIGLVFAILILFYYFVICVSAVSYGTSRYVQEAKRIQAAHMIVMNVD